MSHDICGDIYLPQQVALTSRRKTNMAVLGSSLCSRRFQMLGRRTRACCWITAHMSWAPLQRPFPHRVRIHSCHLDLFVFSTKDLKAKTINQTIRGGKAPSWLVLLLWTFEREWGPAVVRYQVLYEDVNVNLNSMLWMMLSPFKYKKIERLSWRCMSFDAAFFTGRQWYTISEGVKRDNWLQNPRPVVFSAHSQQVVPFKWRTSSCRSASISRMVVSAPLQNSPGSLRSTWSCCSTWLQARDNRMLRQVRESFWSFYINCKQWKKQSLLSLWVQYL